MFFVLFSILQHLILSTETHLFRVSAGIFRAIDGLYDGTVARLWGKGGESESVGPQATVPRNAS